MLFRSVNKFERMVFDKKTIEELQLEKERNNSGTMMIPHSKEWIHKVGKHITLCSYSYIEQKKYN